MRECPTAPRRPALRRGPAALGAALAVVLATVVPLAVAGPAGAATRCDGGVAPGQVRVVVVVDRSSSAPEATCLVVDGGTTGAQVLAQRASLLGRPAPRYADSGLLCAIDGYPATGCGDRTGGTYQYWAYFSGTSGSWVYGSGNPFIRRMADGDIEGWHFITGTGSDPDQPPRMAPSPSLFPPLPPPTAAPAPSGPSGPSAGGGGVGGRPGGAAIPAPASGAGAPADGGAVAGDPSAPATDRTADPTATDTTAPDPTAVSTTTAGTTAGSDPAVDELAATPASSEGGGAGGTVGLVVGIVLIAAVGGGAVVRARTRR